MGIKINIPEKNKYSIKLIDTSYREGLQSAYRKIFLSKFCEYLKIAHLLGINDYELSGCLVDRRHLKELEKYPKSRFYFHCRPTLKNLDFLLSKNIRHISTFIDYQNQSKEQLLFFKKIKNPFFRVRIGIEHAFAIPTLKLKKIVKQICANPATVRICFSDTSGLCTPEKLKKIFFEVIPLVKDGLEIEFHFHNDLGLAAANLFQLYGFRDKTNRLAVSVSLNGAGERNGVLSHGDFFSLFAIFCSSVKKNNGEGYKNKNIFKTEVYASLFKLIFPFKENSFCRDPLSKNAFSHYAKSHIAGISRGEAYSAQKAKKYGYRDTFYRR